MCMLNKTLDDLLAINATHIKNYTYYLLLRYSFNLITNKLNFL